MPPCAQQHQPITVTKSNTHACTHVCLHKSSCWNFANTTYPGLQTRENLLTMKNQFHGIPVEIRKISSKRSSKGCMQLQLLCIGCKPFLHSLHNLEIQIWLHSCYTNWLLYAKCTATHKNIGTLTCQADISDYHEPSADWLLVRQGHGCCSVHTWS
jgi:hypothetical protein